MFRTNFTSWWIFNPDSRWKIPQWRNNRGDVTNKKKSKDKEMW